jgi:hypothetical protein
MSHRCRSCHHELFTVADMCAIPIGDNTIYRCVCDTEAGTPFLNLLRGPSPVSGRPSGTYAHTTG